VGDPLTFRNASLETVQQMKQGFEIQMLMQMIKLRVCVFFSFSIKYRSETFRSWGRRI